MATLYGDNYQAAYEDELKSMIDAKELSGKSRYIYDKITLAAELSVSDVIKAGKLPPGAKIVDARVVINTADSASGQLDLGWESNGTDAADQDGLMAGASEVDFGGSAVDAKMLGSAAGWAKNFADVETELVFTCVEASSDSTGNDIEWLIEYVVE